MIKRASRKLDELMTHMYEPENWRSVFDHTTALAAWRAMVMRTVYDPARPELDPVTGCSHCIHLALEQHHNGHYDVPPVGRPHRCAVCGEWFETQHAVRAHHHDPAQHKSNYGVSPDRLDECPRCGGPLASDRVCADDACGAA